MEPEHIRLDPERTIGLELLSFPGVEIEQTIGSKHSFNTVGTLDVLHFPEYGRFILSLHHWKFPLFKELPVIKSSEGFVDPIIYILPIDDGFYTLKFTQVFHVEGIENLETIFKHNTSFISGTDAQALMSGGYDYEPLPRSSLYGVEEPDRNRTGLSNTPVKEGSGVKLRKRDIIKREVIRAADTIVHGIQKKKPENINMSVLRDYEGLVTTTEDLVPSQYIWKKDVEKMLFDAKELIQRIEGDSLGQETYPIEHRGFMNTLRSSALEVRERLRSRIQHSLEMARSTNDESQPRTSLGEKLATKFPAIGKCYNPSHDRADLEYEAHLPSYLINRENLDQAVYTNEVRHRESFIDKIKERIPPMPSCGRDTTMDRDSTLTIVERVKHAIPHHERVTEDQTFQYRPEGPGLVEKVKAKIPEMVLRVRENFDSNRTSDDQVHPSVKEKIMVDLGALKYHAGEYAHLAKDKIPEKIHNIRESMKNPNGQIHPTLGEKVVDNLRGFKHQVEEYAHLVAENEKVIHMVDKVKAGLHDIRDQLDSRKNMDISMYDVPLDPMIRADSISMMEDYQMRPIDIQPMYAPSQQASLSERITDIFIGQMQAGNIQETPVRGAYQQQNEEPMDFVCSIPSHNHHVHEEERPQGEPIQEYLTQEEIKEQLEEIVKEQLPEGVLLDEPATILDERMTRSEPGLEVDDSSRRDLMTEEIERMQDLQRQTETINLGENNAQMEDQIYREKEAVIEPQFSQPVEQLETVDSSRRRVHIFDDKAIVGTNSVVRSRRTPKKIFDQVRNSQEFDSMTHSQG